MSEALFAYGTLEIPEVMRAVTGRSFPAQPAELPGYARALLRGAPYAGIAPCTGARTEGVLYTGLDARTLALLDAFEGEPYRRRRVHVVPCAAPALVGFSYVVPREQLSREPWDREGFAATRLADLLARCGALRREPGRG